MRSAVKKKRDQQEKSLEDIVDAKSISSSGEASSSSLRTDATSQISNSVSTFNVVPRSVPCEVEKV